MPQVVFEDEVIQVPVQKQAPGIMSVLLLNPNTKQVGGLFTWSLGSKTGCKGILAMGYKDCNHF